MGDFPGDDSLLLVESCIRSILINDREAAHPIVLAEKDGPRTLTISIGIFEAMTINRHVIGEMTARPHAHELLSGVINALGGRLLGVAITDIRDGTFYGILQLENAEGVLVDIDCRPSDALALASLHPCPIYVAEHVFEEAAD